MQEGVTVLKAVPISHRVLKGHMLTPRSNDTMSMKARHDSSQAFAATQWQSEDPRMPVPTKTIIPLQ